MNASSCPLCGLSVSHETAKPEMWECPRCLARSFGALSVALEPAPRRTGSRRAAGARRTSRRRSDLPRRTSAERRVKHAGLPQHT